MSRSSTTPALPKPRYPWVDGLKALGIFFVVLGHLPIAGPVHGMIYAFHMPLFFMVSGFLMSPGGWAMPAVTFYRKRLHRLLGYYAVFGLICSLFYCYIFRDEQGIMEMLRGRVWSLIYGSASHNSPADLFPLVLWYFPGLVVAMILNYLCWNISNKGARVTAFVGLFVAGVALHGKALPWELESGMIAAGFIAVGHVGRILSLDAASRPRHFLIILPVAAIGLGLMAAGYLRPLDIREAGVPWPGSVFGYVGLTLMAVATAIATVLWLSASLKPFPVPRWVKHVSAATIWIFPLHMLAFPYVDRVVAILPGSASWLDSQIYYWLKAVAVTAAITMACHAYHQGMRLIKQSNRAGSSPSG